METNPIQKTPIGLSILRWFTRIFSLLLVGIFIFQMFEASLYSSGKVSDLGYIEIAALLMMLGTIVSLMLGFKWEILGGVINILCVFVLSILIATRAPVPFAVMVFGFPGILYILTGYFQKKLLKK